MSSSTNAQPILEHGAKLTKYGRQGKPHSRFFLVDAERGVLLWRASKDKKKNEGQLKFADVHRLQAGRTTEVFLRYPKRSKAEQHLSFSLIYGYDRSLDLVCSTIEEFDAWFQGLSSLIAQCHKKTDDYHTEQAFVRRLWEKADKDHSGELDLKEVQSILMHMNIEVSKKQLKAHLKAFDQDNNKRLDFQEFTRLVEALSDRDEFEELFRSLSKGKDCMSVERFTDFLKNSQRESGTRSTEDIHRILHSVDAQFDARRGVSKRTFVRYLISMLNGATDEDTELDTTRPITHYYMASSHNTYLEADQLKGNSSVNMYIRALHMGCKCLELDCWDGSDGEPVIYHGHTLTSKILFRDVVEAISQHAFVKNDNPIVLSLENHCSVPQQKVMAQHLVSFLQPHLFLLDDADASVEREMPSLSALQRKILIKGKRLPPSVDVGNAEEVEVEMDFDSSDSDDSDDTTGKSSTKSKSKKAKKKKLAKIAPELSRLVLLSSVKHKPFTQENMSAAPAWQMSSFSEKKFTRLSEKDPGGFARYNCKQFSRCYPSGMRVSSSNYDPVPAWAMGCQIVALNYQTPDLPVLVNQVRFRQNSQSGYLLKPKSLLTRDKFDFHQGPFPHQPLTMRLTVLSACHLPKPGLSAKGEVVDPYVRVCVSGLPQDEQSFETKAVSDNGFNPVWKHTCEFTVTWDELTTLVFMVFDHDTLNDDFICYGGVPVSAFKDGIRSVPLCDADHHEIPRASLLAQLERVE